MLYLLESIIQGGETVQKASHFYSITSAEYLQIQLHAFLLWLKFITK